MLANEVNKQQDSNHSNASEDVAQMMAQMVCLKVEAPTQALLPSMSHELFRRYISKAMHRPPFSDLQTHRCANIIGSWLVTILLQSYLKQRTESLS